MSSRLTTALAELKRRHVYQVAAVYIVVGLGILGTSEMILDPLGLGAARPFIVIVTLLGFPIALVLAWAYEVRPEEPKRAESPPTPAPEKSPDARKSIVVLPFDNMSPDPNDAYFSDGLTEEITTHVSCCGLLRVISRNSAMALKGTRKDTRTIAKELDVQWVLEGSVRKIGDDIRITAQLIDAELDSHIWAETYDGTLQDVFRFQETVARSIVDALQLRFRPEEERRLTQRPIENLQAYEYFLRARHEFWSLSEGSADRSLELIEHAIEIVGDNELLYAAKGMALFQLVNALSRPPETYEGLLGEAQRYVDRVLTLNPASATGNALQGFVHVNSGNPQGAVRHFAEALRLDPDNTDALLYLGFMSAVGGWDREGCRLLFGKVAMLDPLTPVSREAVNFLHWFEGDFGTALAGFQSFFKEAEEGKSPFRIFAAYLHAAHQDLAEAILIVDQMIDDSSGHLIASLAAFLKHAWLGEREAALDAVTADLEMGARWDDFWPLVMADAYSLCREQEKALFWLEHAIDYGITNVRYLSEFDPFLADLRSHDRFPELMRKAADLAEATSSGVTIADLV